MVEYVDNKVKDMNKKGCKSFGMKGAYYMWKLVFLFANNCTGVKILCVGLQAAFLGHRGYEGQCYTPSSLTSTLTLEVEHATSHRARKDVDSRPQWPEAAHVESARVFDLSV